MINKISINNFKSLNNFSMDCSQIMCLIGRNYSGKTTILQAFQFLNSIALGNSETWMIDNKMERNLDEGTDTTFELKFTIDGIDYSWSGIYNRDRHQCTAETIISNIPILCVENNAYRFDKDFKCIDLDYDGSLLAHLRGEILSEELKSIKDFLQTLCVNKFNDWAEQQLIIKESIETRLDLFKVRSVIDDVILHIKKINK